MWQTTSAFTSKLYAYNMSVGGKFKIQCSDIGILFFPDFLSAQNMVWVILGKIGHIEMNWGETKFTLS